MTETSYVRYELTDSYIHNWLVLGPQTRRAEGAGNAAGGIAAISPGDGGIAATAVEPAAATDAVVTVGDYEGQWQAYACLEDHLVDLSQMVDSGHMLRAWAYVELESDANQSVVVTLSTMGACDIWINDHRVHRSVHAGERLRSSQFEAGLVTGRNQILVCFDAVSDAGAACLATALRVQAASPDAPVTVCVPTKIQPLERRNRLEAVFGCAQMKQYVFARKELVQFNWPQAALFPEIATSAEALPDYVLPTEAADLARGSESPASGATETGPSTGSQGQTSFTIRMRTPAGRIYGESDREAKAGAEMHMGHGYRYPDGPLEAVLMPRAREYYQGNMRVSRTLRFWGLDNNPFTDRPVGTYEGRRREALMAAARREANLYSEIAKMAVNWWSTVEPKVILAAAERQRTPDHTIYRDLIGLLGMIARYGDAPEFPADVAATLTEALVDVTYWPELQAEVQDAGSEGTCFLSSVCEILTGQLLPELVFSRTGQPGAWHRERGEAAALAWMRERAMKGFAAWGSDSVYEETLLALAHLVDLADDDGIWNMSTVLLDKILFLLAASSFKGIFGLPKRATSTVAVLGGTFDAVLGTTKLMWGTGIFNRHIRAAVSLACMEEYQLPVMLQEIAVDLPEEGLWGHEHHAPEGAGDGVDLVTFKTPDFMLSAAQDYRHGEPGCQEHVWQATLGAGATIFVNHPVCATLDDARSPNFWRGNGVLPRVAQWRDALIALYRLPEDDWMGFTHAYFPVHAFDAYELRAGWAFAKKGDG